MTTTTLLRNRRTFLAYAATGLAGLSLFRGSRHAWAEPVTETEGPILRFQNPALQSLHGTAFQNALRNLLVTNTMPDTTKHYNRTGLFLDPPGRFIRAGGGYATPWTRDAAINSWGAASLLTPIVAKNTLWAVCERQANGKLIVQRDNQWWDKVIWAQGAWMHFLITGDRDFLRSAYEAVTESLQETRRAHFNARLELFEGPSCLCDGIAGYPQPPYDPTNQSSFILDHPGGDKVLCLSTNCVQYQAHRCAAWMAEQLGRPAAEVEPFKTAAAQLREAINRQLWIPAKSSYGYFIHGTGPLAGKLDDSQEALGLAYAILFNVADAKQVQDIRRTVHLKPKGIVCVWPHFARFNDKRPGRHNVMVWPMASGMWAQAAAQAGDVARFQSEMTNVATMTSASQGIFYEIYNSITGVPDGGWQVGRRWESVIHQTWSATGYLRMVFYGLFGFNFEPDRLRLTPTLPPGWGDVRLSGLRYRQMTLDLRLQGEGRSIANVRLDGNAAPSAIVLAQLTGKHELTIRLQPT